MSLEAKVQEWLRLDKNSDTRNTISSLFEQKEWAKLDELLGKRISFGTAGLRARMEAGFSRMNDLTVIQASQGLCAYVLAQIDSAREQGVVIGHDHRHHSERFAKLSAAAFINKGVKVYLLRDLSCTPLVPFAIGALKAASGIMITASHNPAADNGYKVYWSNGVQIIGPHDTGIAKSIDDNLEVEEKAWNADLVDQSELCVDKTAEIHDAYFKMIGGMCSRREANSSSKLQVVYTPMHGVGLPFAQQALQSYGFSRDSIHVVGAQADPDPDFKTVAFPNPEEKGALDLAMKHADEKGISLVFANDPDADRFCVAEKTNGKWTAFTGDQLGAIFGYWIFQCSKNQNIAIDKLAMLASTVSSKLLQSMAETEGFTFEETLTGFKYLGNAAKDLEAKGFSVAFAYEEAIGYMCSQTVRDKDGISALAVFMELATAVYDSGRTVNDYLEDIYRKYGFFSTLNSYFICRDTAKIARIFKDLRYQDQGNLEKPSYPQSLAGLQVVSIRDLTIGYDSSKPPTYQPSLPVSESTEMITFSLQAESGSAVDKIVFTLRTSGTEPKIKYYIEAKGDFNRQEEMQQILEKVRSALGNDWLRYQEHGLELPAVS